MSKNKHIIVKVQRSLSPGPEQMLIYDPTKEYLYEGPMSPDIDELLGKQDKAYFVAELIPNKDGKTYEIAIIDFAKQQPW